MLASENYGEYVSKLMYSGVNNPVMYSRWRDDIANYGEYEGFYDFIKSIYQSAKAKIDAIFGESQSGYNTTIRNIAKQLPIVRYGSRGLYVKFLQKLLKKAGYNIKVDGIFGRQTFRAVIDFQKKHGLAVDGIVGINTWTKLMQVTGSLPPTYLIRRKIGVYKPIARQVVKQITKDKISNEINKPKQSIQTAHARLLDMLAKNWLLFVIAGAGLLAILIVAKKRE